MSADNYLFVCKRADGKWVIEQRFASWDDYPDEHEAGKHVYGEYDSPEKAVIDAHRLNAGDHWTEHGVHLSPATRKAVHG